MQHVISYHHSRSHRHSHLFSLTASATSPVAAFDKEHAPTEQPPCPVLVPSSGIEKGRDPHQHSCGNSLCPSNGQNVTLKFCPCRGIAYCSKVCQKQHWPFHQAGCTIAKANEDAKWMADVSLKPGQHKRPAMHGSNPVQSKCLECKRTVSIEPDVKYVNFVLCRFM
jgi:MYND finger